MRPESFDSFEKLPSHMRNSAKAIMQLASDYFEGAPSPIFDWGAFKTALDAYKGNDLKYENIKSHTIKRSDTEVDAMVDAVITYLDTFGAKVDRSMLEAECKATTNLRISEYTDGLYSKRSGENSSFSYSITFAYLGFSDYFHSLIFAIKLKAWECTEKDAGFVRSSETNFSAEVNTMELIIKDTFSGIN
ncbi:delta-endotoxin CytB [Rhodocollybia butyracea]|uniref:Delta-endotoxin CytB n=1 Tax=Rhodocollybia butyracea TaxID=206335 RepID=A0A9P5UCG6_9AGAR|nr:delta-endotoxin CytB [Rhodocollybia butyracea]